MLKPKLHFQRFEFKYLITFDQLHKIKSFLKRYVELDKYAQQTRSGFYEVISLYFDSPKFYYYQEKVDGVKKRKKIRLRTYRVNGQFIDYAFFEIKRKHDAIILKDRFLLSKNEYFDAVQNNLKPINNDDKNKNNIVEEYLWEKNQRLISPKVLVAYSREPYLGKFNKNFRVTFDYHIKSKAGASLYEYNSDLDNVLDEGAIMEIKFNGRLPHYIQKIIDKYDLQRIAYSKYCQGVETCYYNPSLRISKNNLLIFDKVL